MPSDTKLEDQQDTKHDEAATQSDSAVNQALQPLRLPVVQPTAIESSVVDWPALKAMLDAASSSADHDRQIGRLIQLAQETNPVLYERKTDRQLRTYGGVLALLASLASICGVVLLGYLTTPPLLVIFGLLALAAAALGVGGAVVTGQKVTVKEVTRGTAELLRSLSEKSEGE